jgi:hypothetical protein
MTMAFALLSLMSMTLYSRHRRRTKIQLNTALLCAEAPSTFKMMR